jgi:glycosyltransferase involved in cell wall biosynthesis
MKLLFIIDHLRADGTQRAVCQLVAGLTARSHQCTLLCLNDSWDTALVDELGALGARVRVVGKLGVLSGVGLAGLLPWLRAERFDAAVTMLFVADVVGRLLARAAGVPRVVSSLRAHNRHYALWQLWLVRATMPLADAVVVNSRATLGFATAAEGARPSQLLCIPNGVDVERFTPTPGRAERRAELGLPTDATLICSAGRLTRQKGLDLLVAALASPGLERAQLLLAGVGEREAELRALAARLGLLERVRFLGYRRDLPALLGAVDLYVHPARFEGMPNALLEAMAVGCPIVATAVDGSAELIVDGVHGWLAPPEDVTALAAAIRAALGDANEARRRGAAARERARSQFSIDAMVEAWERVLCGPESAEADGVSAIAATGEEEL